MMEVTSGTPGKADKSPPFRDAEYFAFFPTIRSSECVDYLGGLVSIKYKSEKRMEGKGREEKRKEWKGREEKRREKKEREEKRKEEKGREGEGRKWAFKLTRVGIETLVLQMIQLLKNARLYTSVFYKLLGTNYHTATI